MGEQQISFSLHAIDVIEQREILIEWVAAYSGRTLPRAARSNSMDPRLLQAFGPVPERDKQGSSGRLIIWSQT